MNHPIKTSVQVACESTADTPTREPLDQIALIDFNRAVAAGVQRVLAGEEFGLKEIDAPSLRYEIASALVQGRYFETVAEAQEFMQILAAAAAGQAMPAAMNEWLVEYRAHLVRTAEMRSRGSAAISKQEELTTAEREAEQISKALAFERQRLESYSVVKELGVKNYFSQIVGDHHIHGLRAVDFMKTWLAEIEVCRFTGEVVIPELERQLTEALQRVRALRPAEPDQETSPAPASAQPSAP